MSRRDVVLNNHLEHAWRRAVVERLDPYLSVDREERIFQLVGGCDPTAQGKYLGWLSAWRRQWWEHHGLRNFCDMIELDRVASGLRCFHQIRRHLPLEMRDINRFASTDDLLGVETYLTKDGASDMRRQLRDVAYAGSDILFDSGRWKLVRLKNQSAASWWGMGTRWCTAARFNNRFDSYAANGPLLVLITPTDRYQFAAVTGEFRNAADMAVNLEDVLCTGPKELRDVWSAIYS